MLRRAATSTRDAGLRLAGAVGSGLEFFGRTAAAPLLLGLRWMRPSIEHARSGMPRPVAGPGLLAKVVLDELFFATELASASLVSLRDASRVVRELEAARELYESRGWIVDPASYHEAPGSVPDVRLDRAGSFVSPYIHLRFESGYAPHVDEPGRERWLSYVPNATAHAWLLEHPGVPRPWLVCVPGYRMGHPAVDFTGFRARWLHRVLGLNVAIPVLPFHGPRRVGRRGGDGYLSGDFIDTIHAQAQAVWDVRRLLSWLRTRDAPAVAVYGVSMGGYTTALLAGLVRDLDCVVAGIPAADYVALIRSHVPTFLLAAVERAGFPLHDVTRILRVVSPLAIPPRVPPERRYLYAGVADRLALPHQVRELWDHWDRPRIAWYEGSHVSFLWERGVAELLREAFQACGLLPSPVRPRIPEAL